MKKKKYPAAGFPVRDQGYCDSSHFRKTAGSGRRQGLLEIGHDVIDMFKPH
jgi:hypothetical protein